MNLMWIKRWILNLLCAGINHQPFIENAIWHCITLKEKRYIMTTVDKTDHTICCILNDDGIGRETSKQINSSLNHLHINQKACI